jgi:4-amino-4-deoxy-L-arabinose transferase-like glycosyltransferase
VQPLFQLHRLRKLQLYGILFLSFAGLLLVSAFFSPVWYDDAGHFIVLRELLAEGRTCYPADPGMGICNPDSPFITMGPALNYPLGSWMGWLGIDMMVARILMVLLSLEALFAFFVLARTRISDRKVVWALVLVMGNIQLLTYGAEVLGEVPMLGWLFLGMALSLRAMEEGKTWMGVLAGLSWGLAMLTKAYLAAPLALALLLWMVWGSIRGEWKRVLATFVQGLIAGGLLLAWQWYDSGSWAELLNWLEQRGSYRSEFMVFNWGETLRFLLFKPVIVLGSIALLVKVRIRKSSADRFLLVFHFCHVLFFLASAGYDRFGFQLMFIPAIYLAEFLAAAWKRLGEMRKWRLPLRFAFVVLVWAVGSQQALYLLAQRALGPEPNWAEKTVSLRLQERDVQAVFTYDQQLIPFLGEEIAFRLPNVVPSNAGACESLNLRRGEWFLAGEYARTEYQDCVAWAELEPMDTVGGGKYVLYRER